MSSFNEQLAKATLGIKPAPSRFSGTFAEFFTRHIEPNLPAPTRVIEFDRLLSANFVADTPIFLVRKVSKLDRRENYLTHGGLTLRPTDNAPAWWLHAYLLSDLPLLDYRAVLEACPRHMFDIGLRNHLSSAGFHLAHIQNTNNRNTDWQNWDRVEIARRMTLNVHPWNWCLLGKPDWGRHGGRHDILSWIQSAYVERYGHPYLEWLQRFDLPRPHETVNPLYEYEIALADSDRTSTAVPRARSEKTRSTTRPIIKREWEAQDVVLDIIASYGRFIVPHDDLLHWVLSYKDIAATVSWQRDGIYSWPKAPADMLAFLRQYEQ